jgi:hypothetical protein
VSGLWTIVYLLEQTVCVLWSKSCIIRIQKSLALVNDLKLISPYAYFLMSNTYTRYSQGDSKANEFSWCTDLRFTWDSKRLQSDPSICLFVEFIWVVHWPEYSKLFLTRAPIINFNEVANDTRLLFIFFSKAIMLQNLCGLSFISYVGTRNLLFKLNYNVMECLVHDEVVC